MKKILIIIFVITTISTSFAQKISLSSGYNNLILDTRFKSQNKELFLIPNIYLPELYLKSDFYLFKNFSVGFKFSEANREKFLNYSTYSFSVRSKIYELNFRYALLNKGKNELGFSLGGNYVNAYLFQKYLRLDNPNNTNVRLIYKTFGYNVCVDYRYKLSAMTFIGANFNFLNFFYIQQRFYNYSLGLNFGIYL